MTKLSAGQVAILHILKSNRGKWMSASDIAKLLKKVPRFEEARSASVSGPAVSLLNKGLIERETRQRKTPMKFRNGRILFPQYHVYKAADAAFDLTLDGEQRELPL